MISYAKFHAVTKRNHLFVFFPKKTLKIKFVNNTAVIYTSYNERCMRCFNLKFNNKTSCANELMDIS